MLLKVADTDRALLDGCPLEKGWLEHPDTNGARKSLLLRNNSTSATTPLQWRPIGNAHPDDGSVRAINFYHPPLSSTSDEYEVLQGGALPKLSLTPPTPSELGDMLNLQWTDENDVTRTWRPKRARNEWPGGGYMQERRYVGGFLTDAGFYRQLWAEALVRVRADTGVLQVWLKICNQEPWGYKRGTRLLKKLWMAPPNASLLASSNWTARYHSASTSQVTFYDSSAWDGNPFPMMEGIKLVLRFYLDPLGGTIAAADRIQPALWQDAPLMVGWHGQTSGFVTAPGSGDVLPDLADETGNPLSSFKRNDGGFVLWSGNPAGTAYTLPRILCRYQIADTNQTGYPKMSYDQEPDVPQLTVGLGQPETYYERMLLVGASQIERPIVDPTVWSQGSDMPIPFRGYLPSSRDRYESGIPNERNRTAPGNANRDRLSMYAYDYDWDGGNDPTSHDLRRTSPGSSGIDIVDGGDKEHDNISSCYQSYLREGCVFFRDAILARAGCITTVNEIRNGLSESEYAFSGRVLARSMDCLRMAYVLAPKTDALVLYRPAFYLRYLWNNVVLWNRGKGLCRAPGDASKVWRASSVVPLPSSGNTVLEQLCDLYGGTNNDGSSFTPWMILDGVRAALMVLEEMEALRVSGFSRPDYVAVRDSFEEALEHTLFTAFYACWNLGLGGMLYKADPTAAWIPWGPGSGYQTSSSAVWGALCSHALDQYSRWDSTWWSANADRIALNTQMRTVIGLLVAGYDGGTAAGKTWSNPWFSHARTV